MLRGSGSNIAHQAAVSSAAVADESVGPPIKSAPVASSVQSRRGLHHKESLESLSLAIKPDIALQVPPLPVMTPWAAPEKYFRHHLWHAAKADDYLLQARVPDVLGPNGFKVQNFILGKFFDDTAAATVRGGRISNGESSQIYTVKQTALPADYRARLFDPSYHVRSEVSLPPILSRMNWQTNMLASAKYALTPHFHLLTEDTLYSFMPLLGGDVEKMLSRISSERIEGPEAAAVDLDIRLAAGYQAIKGVVGLLQQMHDKNHAHRDIKPTNIVLRQDGEMYLVDFDAASKMSPALLPKTPDGLVGTVEFMAPEALLGAPHDSRKADIWSLGVSVVSILLGRQFADASSKDWQKMWQAAVVQARSGIADGFDHEPDSMAAEIAGLHADLRDFAPQFYPMLLRMLDVRPEQRPTAAQVGHWLEQLSPQDRPSLKPFLQELHLQAESGMMPVAAAIAGDERLMRAQPGERAGLRPSARRANSAGNPLRPFVWPFSWASNHAPAATDRPASGSGSWQKSPRFDEVKQFLEEQDYELFLHYAAQPGLL